MSLVNEYVVNEYDLVPEEILSDSAADRSPLDAKNSLPTNEEIFTELISQRLAQGFQLILLTPQVSYNLSIQGYKQNIMNIRILYVKWKF